MSATPRIDQQIDQMYYVHASNTAWACFGLDYPMGRVDILDGLFFVLHKDDVERSLVYQWAQIFGRA